MSGNNFKNLSPFERMHITEHYTDFTDATLIRPAPMSNWPNLFGKRAVTFINQSLALDNKDGPIKVLVVHGSAGRSTLELLRGCQNLNIEHTDVNASKVKVLESLLNEGRIDWSQQIEGDIVKECSYELSKTESKEILLNKNKNIITFSTVDYKNLGNNFNEYDVILCDFRFKNSAEELFLVSERLKTNGILILGSIDDVTETDVGIKHPLTFLKSNFAPIEVSGNGNPHIYKETRNKHQFAVSYFSIWKKTSSKMVCSDALSKYRIAKSSSYVESTTVYYEDTDILTSYDRFHFGEGLLTVKNFPLRMAEVCIAACKKYKSDLNSALDAGCGPGRTALELSRVFQQVEGYDYSQGFVDMMLKNREARNIKNLKAYQGDSHAQKDITELKKFDLIFGCNLIDRLHTPDEWVIQSKNMLNPGGLLIIASPYTWKADHTEPSKWIGGFVKNNSNHFTEEGLKRLLTPRLDYLETEKVPFVIPDADGTYQYTYSNCTIFQLPRN